VSRRFHPFLLVPFLMYGLTCSRHVGLPDSAVILGAMRNLEMGVQAWNHPLTNLLGWFALHLLPGENEFLKVNLVSTLGGGIAIGLFYLALVRMRVPRLPAALGASAFMLSHSMWWHAVWVESYAWNVVFLLACLHLLLPCGGAEPAGETGVHTPARHPVVMPALLFFTAGLGLFNHLQNGALLLAAPGVMVWRTRRLPPEVRRDRWFLTLAAALLLGLLPYVATVGWSVHQYGFQWTFLYMTGGEFRPLFWNYGGSKGLMEAVHLLFLQFPSGWVAVGLVALAWQRLSRNRTPDDAGGPPVRRFLLAVLAINLVVFLGYRTWDQYAFLLVSFAILAFLAALGLGRMWDQGGRCGQALAGLTLAVGIAVPPLLYPRIPEWVRTGDGYWATRYGHIERQYRDRYDLVGLLVDPVGQDGGSVEEYARQAVAFMRMPARVYDDGATFYQIAAMADKPGQFICCGVDGPWAVSERMEDELRTQFPGGNLPTQPAHRGGTGTSLPGLHPAGAPPAQRQTDLGMGAEGSPRGGGKGVRRAAVRNMRLPISARAG
jgi:hypothetical protein